MISVESELWYPILSEHSYTQPLPYDEAADYYGVPVDQRHL